MVKSKGMAARDEKAVFEPYEFERQAVGDDDVLIKIEFAGICHSDIHTVRGDWGPANYPLVPGHEIAGRVVEIGKNVTKFAIGDKVGVGCMVNSCGHCSECQADREQFCLEEAVWTYGSEDRFHDGAITQGGYSNNIVVNEKFAIKVADGAPLDKVAPLLCAGITTYSPIKAADIKAGDVVAVAGFGGLGHMAVQYLVKFGAKVTVFDVNPDKTNAALELGANELIDVNDTEKMASIRDKFDFIISTIPTKYEVLDYVKMLKTGGLMTVVGMPAISDTPNTTASALIHNGQKKLSGSLIGGIAETQEMLDYSIENNIYPLIEIIAPDEITTAYQKVLDGEVRFRYVVDISKL
jgi:uncharacterized zinc-type alcohol dehydrogenase-like protein